MKLQNKTITVSIIIVNYHVKDELFACLKSIIISKPKVSYEVIVIDNDEKETIKVELFKNFPQVIYIKNPENVGFGTANNIAADHAHGEYLFFLNPDTLIFEKTVDNLINFLNKNPKAAIVAPLLLGTDGKPYQQGTKELTPLRGIIALSFINKLSPKNKISNEYFLLDWDRKNTKEVDVAPGTAFAIQKKFFNKVGGFDKSFFLFFEEFDLCKRVKQLGYKIYILPSAKVKHLWGNSTIQKKDSNEIFAASRRHYFKKHFGFFTTLLIETFLGINKYTAVLVLALLAGFFVTTYRLRELMPFIGDYAWFYISGRDIWINGTIPLVGIASSHPWLHQGALWTYILAPVLAIFTFNPVSGVFAAISFFLLTIILLYKFGSEIFTRSTGVIAALLYATSPLAILHARSPYHTSPIPFFTTIYFYAMYKWVKGDKYFFPLIIFMLSILYNLEIATFLLTIVFGLVFLFGIVKKKLWVKVIVSKKIILFSIAAFLLPMLPMLIYDLGHGFPQTIKFIAWLGYKILVLFGYPPLQTEVQTGDFKSAFLFLVNSYQRLVYIPNHIVAFTIAVFSFGFLVSKMYVQVRTKKYDVASILMSLIVVVCLVGILATKTVSEAYLPVFFPIITLITAAFFAMLLEKRKTSNVFILLTIVLICFMNVFTLIQQSYFTGKSGSISDKITLAKKIVSEANGRRYNLLGRGESSQFESFTMPYEYLTWWLGYPPSKEKEKLHFVITEENGRINVKQEVVK